MILNKSQRYSFVSIMKPFKNLFDLEDYKRKLGFEHAGVNSSRKIWFFWRTIWEDYIIVDTVQQITLC